MDYLSRAGTGTGGRTEEFGLMLQNLAAVTANYRRAGIQLFVVAYLVRSPGEVAGVPTAPGLPLRVPRSTKPASGLEPFALDLHVRAVGAGECGGGHIAQHLLHRGRTANRIGLECSPVGGVLARQMEGGGDQRAGGHTSGDDEEQAVGGYVGAVIWSVNGYEDRTRWVLVRPGHDARFAQR